MNKPDEAQIIGRLKQIQQMIDRKQLQEAAQALNALATVMPNDPRLFLLGSHLADAAGNPAGALEAAQKAYKLHPQWSAGALRLAQVQADRGNHADAISKVAVAVKVATNQGILNDQLLIEAATVCMKVNQAKQALAWLQEAQAIAPQNANIKLAMAHAHAYDNNPEQAVELYNELLIVYPGMHRILMDRGLAYLKLKKLDLARADFEALAQIAPDDQRVQYHLAQAKGETPKSQPAETVSSLFDRYAGRFDQHLVIGLKYRLPKDVAELILGWYPDKDCDVLDLGCGTGLLGACLGPMKGVVVGVDLSMGMIEQAQKHRVYDKFHHTNAVEALAATPAAQYDIITALDMLNYIGDLSSLVPNAARVLNPGGRFVFSCETAGEGIAEYFLPATTQRYTHNPTYVRALLEDAGFNRIEFIERPLRMEKNAPVDSFLVIAQT